MVTFRRVLVALILCTATQSAFASVDAEIKRLDALLVRLEAANIAAPFNETLPPLKASLERVKNTKAPELKLYRLRDAFTGIETMAFFAAHDAKTYEGIEKLWNERRERFEKLPAVAPGTMLQIALQQAALNRAQKLFNASLPYGKASGPPSGVYYIGEAEGNLAYARFIASLASPAAAQEKRPSAAALKAAIEALDTESIAVFEKEPTARTAIMSSVLLKETRELLARGWIEAATFTLLEARFDLTRRQTEKKEFTPTARGTDSIEGLWAAVSRESERGDAAVAAVIPFYRGLATNAPAKTATTVTKPVAMTLIRWPYT